MLIKCPECELQVSNKAITCPHCGYPLHKKIVTINMDKEVKRRRKLPNGFGQISKINKGNLKNKYRAMYCVGKDKNGRPISRILKPKGYFKTYNEAYQALVEFNKSPIDLVNGDITMDELFHLWYEQKIKELNKKSSADSYYNAWKYAISIYNLKVNSIKIAHLKKCIDEGYAIKKGVKVTPTPVIKVNLKFTLNMMFDYAVENEIVVENIARKFKINKAVSNEVSNNQIHHISFTNEEMKTMWDNLGTIKYLEIILVQCYMGWRPIEILEIKIKNIDMKKRIIVGGKKTKNGLNRIVPIHSKIYPIVKKQYDIAKQNNSEYLFFDLDNESGEAKKIEYYRYARIFKDIVINVLNLSNMHKPHDCRKQFVTMAKRYNVDEYAIKHMTGHAITDLTERVYTDRDIEWLKKEIEKIV